MKIIEPRAIFTTKDNPYSSEAMDGIQLTYKEFSRWDDAVIKQLEKHLVVLPWLPGVPKTKERLAQEQVSDWVSPKIREHRELMEVVLGVPDNELEAAEAIRAFEFYQGDSE